VPPPSQIVVAPPGQPVRPQGLNMKFESNPTYPVGPSDFPRLTIEGLVPAVSASAASSVREEMTAAADTGNLVDTCCITSTFNSQTSASTTTYYLSDVTLKTYAGGTG
jgi:hypothetical protein